MLTTNINHSFYKSFIERYSDDIDRLYPELKDVEITLTDDGNPNRTPYLLGHESESPLVCTCNDEYEGVIYNDVVCINNLTQDIFEDAFHALAAHEIGHFVYHYRNMNMGGQEEEIFADEVALSLVSRNALVEGLTHSKDCVEKSIDAVMQIFDDLLEKKKEQIQMLEERINRISYETR